MKPTVMLVVCAVLVLGNLAFGRWEVALATAAFFTLTFGLGTILGNRLYDRNRE